MRHCCTIITNLFVAALHGINVNDVWFQQDGATCHTPYATFDILRQAFDGRLIHQNDDVNWSTKSCNLTLSDYFLFALSQQTRDN